MSDFPSDIPIDERLLSMNESLYFEFLDQNQKEYKSTLGTIGTFTGKLNAFDQDLQQASFVIFDQIQDSFVMPKSTGVAEVPEIEVPTKRIASNTWMPWAILAVVLVTILFMFYMSQQMTSEKMVL